MVAVYATKFNLLKPTGYVMHQQFNIQQLFCIYLRTNNDLCHLHNKLIGFYNRDEKCLLHGTNWVFKYSSLRFVFKGLTYGMSAFCLHSLLVCFAWFS